MIDDAGNRHEPPLWIEVGWLLVIIASMALIGLACGGFGGSIGIGD